MSLGYLELLSSSPGSRNRARTLAHVESSSVASSPPRPRSAVNAARVRCGQPVVIAHFFRAAGLCGSALVCGGGGELRVTHLRGA